MIGGMNYMTEEAKKERIRLERLRGNENLDYEYDKGGYKMTGKMR